MLPIKPISPEMRRVMDECQDGYRMSNGFRTGRVCKKPELCYQEGGCYFVLAVQAHLEAEERAAA
jgi:hypothetical protein